MHYDIATTSELTTDTCKIMISKQCNSAWQTRWDRPSVARTTYDLAPTVGQTTVPGDRCCTVNYARLAHQHRHSTWNRLVMRVQVWAWY